MGKKPKTIKPQTTPYLPSPHLPPTPSKQTEQEKKITKTEGNR